MKYLHTMVRVSDVDRSLDFYCNKLGFREVRRIESPQGRFTLIYLAAPGDTDDDAQLELTYNWDPEAYGEGRNFGHLAYEVDDIYATCEKLMKKGVTINRPPRDGHMILSSLKMGLIFFTCRLSSQPGSLTGKAPGLRARFSPSILAAW